MFLKNSKSFSALSFSIFLAIAGAARAQYSPTGPGVGAASSPSFPNGSQKASSEATGVERNGVYEETEVKHSWFSFTKPAEKTPEAEFERAEKFRAAGDFKSAGRAFYALTITWPRAPQAAVAQQRYAEMLAAREKFEDAFEQFDRLIDRYLGSFDYTAIIEAQFGIAQKIMSQRKGKVLLFGGFKAPERAIPLFESILKHAPRWPGAPEAQYLIGVANEMIGEYDLAVVAYMNTQHRYPDSQFAEKASFGRAHCLYLITQENPNDPDALEQAYAGAVVFLNAFPQSDHADLAIAYKETLLRKREEVAYGRGVFYEKVAHQPKAALMSFEAFVAMYPNSPWTPSAKERIESLRISAGKSKVNKNDET